MVSCAITSSNGFRLTGDRACQELTRLGRIGWTFVLPPVPIAQSEPTARTIFYPRRLSITGPEQIRSWPPLHKQVYGLADGTRSIMDIADQLSVPPKLIEEALRDLRSVCAIVIE